MDILVVIIGIFCCIALVLIGVVVGGLLSINKYFKSAAKLMDNCDKFMEPLSNYYLKAMKDEFDD